MRLKKNDLLDVDNDYQKCLIEDEDFDCDDKESLKKTFKDIISDYKKVLKKCKKEGIDTGVSEEQQYQKLFELGDINEKEEIISEMKDNIKSLLDLCNIPEIASKYFKDLVDIMYGQEKFED